jgi:fumarylacetoacetase
MPLADTFTLPYGSCEDRTRRYVGVRLGDQVLDVAAAVPAFEPLLRDGTLDGLLAAGPAAWTQLRRALLELAADPDQRQLRAIRDVRLRMPFTVADYVDFYASEYHVRNVARVLRPEADPLPANWKHLPAGYHGRAGTVVVSGTPVVRPAGLRRLGGAVSFGPTERLDFEAEVGFVVGTPAPSGRVPVSAFADHVFGLCLVNDWSARDIQAFETVPLGPFLGKSFATSISPWIVPLDALIAARTGPPPRDVSVADYLDDSGTGPGGFDLELEVRLNGATISRPPFRSMYWTPAQMLAHLGVNGAAIRTGDLYASGTVSGPRPGQFGCLLELPQDGSEPVTLTDGSRRRFLLDGDEVDISATAPGPDGSRLELGAVAGRIEPAARIDG